MWLYFNPIQRATLNVNSLKIETIPYPGQTRLLLVKTKTNYSGLLRRLENVFYMQQSADLMFPRKVTYDNKYMLFGNNIMELCGHITSEIATI